MLDNHIYNLMKQIVQEHKSLWRIKNNYIKDAEGRENEQDFWKKMEKDKEEHTKDLLNLLKKDLG